MDTDHTFLFYNKLIDDKLCLLYNGSFSDSITHKFIALSEYNLSANEDLSKIRNRVSFLMAECFQNIVRHGEGKNTDNTANDLPGFFSTKNIGNTYFITSGNLINKTNIPRLEGQLKQVNSLNSDELKELYRNVIENQGFSEKGGAGLGLIEMARKSGHRIEYDFEAYDEIYSFFYNQIRLEKNPEPVEFSLDQAVIFHRMMKDQGILLLQKGDFSQETILPVLNIIEQNFRKDKTSSRNKSVYHVLVELLQNISRNSLEIDNRHEGIFMIQQTGENYIVSAGNLISAAKVADFERRLKKVQPLREEELEKLYQKELLDDNIPGDEIVGLGLIDIAREGSEPFQFQFHELDQDKMFFSIRICL
jgi:hypothetical protein